MNNRRRKLLAALLAVGMATSLTACCVAELENASSPEKRSEIAVGSTADTAESTSGVETDAGQTEIKLLFGDTVMTALLDDSKTSRAFIKMLPLTLTMNRYADREYYAALGELPESGDAIEDYENGDVTYYTDGKSLAIFFGNADRSSQSGLIRMGRITTDLGLFDTIGERAEVTISLLASEADMADFDFSVFNNVKVTGVNISALSADEQAVLYQQARYCQAMTEADTDTLSEIVASDKVFTHMSGRQQSKEEYLADIADGSLRYFTVGIENPVIEINGNYASVKYTSVLNANAYGATGTYRINGTHWFEKQDGVWIACNAPKRL